MTFERDQLFCPECNSVQRHGHNYPNREFYPGTGLVDVNRWFVEHPPTPDQLKCIECGKEYEHDHRIPMPLQSVSVSVLDQGLPMNVSETRFELFTFRRGVGLKYFGRIPNTGFVRRVR